ncbi:DUF4234 domain-containing protein [Mumia sp. Pv 4-285]|uniref:DUF4234 domain-containing protein n=1 Tax=Mumia qirimensis TaxID=3234852 RepID=UPI00351D6139
MTDSTLPPAPANSHEISHLPAPSTPYPGAPLAPQHAAVAPYPPAAGPLGKVRSTGVCMLLTIVTLGFYQLYWWYKTHEEMKRHSQQGLGGGIALLLTIFVGIVMPYVTSNEVGGLYERRGQKRPVSAVTGLWYFPGMFILVGPFVWFIKTNGALNAYWRSLGAR